VSNVIGEIGKGYLYAISILNEGRIGIGSQVMAQTVDDLFSTLYQYGKCTSY